MWLGQEAAYKQSKLHDPADKDMRP
jgi:hypothetical protein